jgi:hypothetical protein
LGAISRLMVRRLIHPSPNAERVYAVIEERGREIAVRKGVSLAQGNVAAMEADPDLNGAYRAACLADQRQGRTAP